MTFSSTEHSKTIKDLDIFWNKTLDKEGCPVFEFIIRIINAYHNV